MKIKFFSLVGENIIDFILQENIHYLPMKRIEA